MLFQYFLSQKFYMNTSLVDGMVFFISFPNTGLQSNYTGMYKTLQST